MVPLLLNRTVTVITCINDVMTHTIICDNDIITDVIICNVRHYY